MKISVAAKELKELRAESCVQTCDLRTRHLRPEPYPFLPSSPSLYMYLIAGL